MFICWLPIMLSGSMQGVVHTMVNKIEMMPDLVELKERRSK